MTRAARVFALGAVRGIDARAAILLPGAALIKAEAESLAALATGEMGKTESAARDKAEPFPTDARSRGRESISRWEACWPKNWPCYPHRNSTDALSSADFP